MLGSLSFVSRASCVFGQGGNENETKIPQDTCEPAQGLQILRCQRTLRGYHTSRDDNQVSEIHIKILHSMDDAEVYNNRKNSITAPVSGKAHHLNVCVDSPRSSQWVLSLEWMEDEALMGSTEHRKLLAQAYRNEEQRRHDVRKELLYEAVDCLPDAEQRLFRQYYIENMTQPEIAKLEGISIPAVQKRRKKLINHLKEIIFKEILLGG